MLALPIFITAFVLVLFNEQTLRQLAFPILLLLFLVPPPTRIIYALGSNLSVLGTQASAAILKLLGFPVVASMTYENPTITIIQPNGTPLPFTIDIACSGIYSLMGFLVFATFVSYIARTEIWKKPAIFLIGLPLIYFLNVMRITIIVLLGYYQGIELALNVFHLLGGWVLIFLGTLLLLIITDKILKIQLFNENGGTQCPQCEILKDYEQEFCLNCGKLLAYQSLKLTKFEATKIASLVIGTILIVSVQAPIFALTRGPADILTQIRSGQQPTTDIFPEISGYELIFKLRDEEFEKIAKQDAALQYAYIPENISHKTIWVALEIASISSSLHGWQSCLGPKEWYVTQLDYRDVELLENPPLIARYFAFRYKKSNITQVVLYWYETSIFTTNTTTEEKFVKISLIANPKENESIQQTEDELLTFGEAIAAYWQPIKSWSEVALLISKHGDRLILIPTIVLLFTILVRLFDIRKIKQRNLLAYRKLPQEIQAVISAVRKTTDTTNIKNIAETYAKINSTSITTGQLNQSLRKAEKTGLIRREIANIQDEPVLIWKT